VLAGDCRRRQDSRRDLGRATVHRRPSGSRRGARGPVPLELSVCETTVPGVDFDRVRTEITMEQVLGLLGFQPSNRSGVHWFGSCRMSPARGVAARSRRTWRSVATFAIVATVRATSLSFGQRRSCPCTKRRLPAMSTPNGSPPSPRPRRSLDSALIMTTRAIIRSRRGRGHQKRKPGKEAATGTRTTSSIETIPSIILIQNVSVMLLTLRRRGDVPSVNDDSQLGSPVR
jgi:hypothetical protein